MQFLNYVLTTPGIGGIFVLGAGVLVVIGYGLMLRWILNGKQ